MTEQNELYLTIGCFLYWIKMGLKKAESKELAKTVVTFYKDESKEVLKHTINYFKKENISVRTIYNIVVKYHKHNPASYLPKNGRPKRNF